MKSNGMICQKDVLKKYYINKKMSTHQIGKTFGVSGGAIRARLIKYNIQLRNRVDAMIIGINRLEILKKKSISATGEKNAMYKDGSYVNQQCKCGNRKTGLSKKCQKCYTKTLMGVGNPAWSGWASRIKYGINFGIVLKRKIRKRDKNICQKCGKRKYAEELAVHHIDYNKKNCKESNLTSLHKVCNTKVNANRDYWYAYFTYIMQKRGIINGDE